MLHRQGKTSAKPAVLRRAFESQLALLESWLTAQPCIEVLPVNYHRLLREPAVVAEELRTFVGLDLDTTAMVCVVDPSLYRQRDAVSQVLDAPKPAR
jgi:hypothetical protein